MGTLTEAPDALVIARLAGVATETLRPLARAGMRCAVVDFPNHRNVGDSAIWLGELACLRSLGVGTPDYVCDASMYQAHDLRAAVRDGTIFLHGGGNLGDLYPVHQEFREKIIADFPDNDIVFFPQTIHFESPDTAARFRRLARSHRRLHLIVRDRRSLDFAREQLDLDAKMAPDMAFCLGPLPRRRPPRHRVLCLARDDRESNGGGDSEMPGVRTCDWGPHTNPWEASTLARLLRELVSRPRLEWLLKPTIKTLMTRLARSRLSKGCDLLAEGRVVATDRLHGHILCMLLGIKHYFADNSYGKVVGFHAAWTSESSLAVRCGSLDEAIANALADPEGNP